MTPRAMAAVAALAAVLAGVAPAAAIVVRHDRDDALYREHGRRPMPLAAFEPDGEGTLIAPRWVLTAAHVVAGTPGMPRRHPPRHLTVAGRRHRIKRVVAHPDWGQPGWTRRGGDLALVKLRRPVPGVTPALLYRRRDETGRVMTFAGRGDTGTGLTGPIASDRVLRAATNRVEGVEPPWLRFVFDRPGSPGVTDLEGISGPGDSGGPALVEHAGALWVAGISSWQRNRAQKGVEGVYGVRELYSRVSTYVEWIESVTGDLPREP